MKICIIGAGVSGLTAGRLLSNDHDVTIYEKNPNIGGIARTKKVDGTTYHLVGGHCLNSKNKDVMDFIFNEVLPEDCWHHVVRDAKINLNGTFISYPIEYSIKEIEKFDNNLAFNITKDFFSAVDKKVDNLADWFTVRFGETLAKEYFIPYNRKIWNMDPSEMSPLWIDGKLPMPDKMDFFNALISNKKDTMAHSTFYYPNSNNQNSFIEALSKNLDIVTNFEVTSIDKVNSKWIINKELSYDLVINTMPLNLLPFVVGGVPDSVKNAAKKLKYNKVTNMLWKTKPIDFTWSYYPSENTIFHRHIHIGNFFKPSTNFTITESIGEHSYEEMVEHGNKFDYLLEPLDYNVSDYAYVVYDQNYSSATRIVKKYFSNTGLYSVGRFGEWEYYNMDVCIESVMKLVTKIGITHG